MVCVIVKATKCIASRLKLTTTYFLIKRTTKTNEHFYNFIAPLTITHYNDRGLGPSLCSLFTIREIKEYMPSYKNRIQLECFKHRSRAFLEVDFEYVLVQSCSVVADLVHILILNSVVMNLIHHLHLRNRLVGQILQVSHPRGIFVFNSIFQSVILIKVIFIS